MDKISFITLTNTGYLNLTLNCLKSIEQQNIEIPLKCYSSDIGGYNTLKELNIPCEHIDNNHYRGEKHVGFGSKEFGELMKVKMKIIYDNLQKYDYVCYTDGDIVFLRDNLFQYLMDNIEDNNILVQNNKLHENSGELCAGFMFIKSNDFTRDLFNLENNNYQKIIEESRLPIKSNQWEDQMYINKVYLEVTNDIFKLKFLPNPTFPCGIILLKARGTIQNPYLIHFNYITANKQGVMAKNGYWFL
jgi:hypothetical protein